MLKIIFPFLIAILLIVLIKRAKRTHGDSCINLETYKLIKESDLSNQLSKYTIVREENKLLFRSKGYTLFFLTLNPNNDQNVELIGLDGYGARNKEFERYICKLIKKIEEES